ncbi:hypothetical protein D3C72_1189860 [compost metagenome]
MLNRKIRFAALLCTGILAGHAVSMVLTVGPSVVALEADKFLELNRVAEPAFAGRVPFLFLAVIISIFTWLVRIRKKWQTREFAFVILSLLCIFEDFYFAFEANVPLNDTMTSWKTVYDLPGNWQEIRLEWYNYMYIHAALLILMFVMLLIAQYFAARAENKKPAHL